MMNKGAKVFVSGTKGMVCSALNKRLSLEGFEVLFPEDINLLEPSEVHDFFKTEKPEYVFLISSEEGGILANLEKPAELMYKNLQMQINVIHLAWRYDVKKLLFLGSSTVYPKLCQQPMSEAALLEGPLEPTSKAYAIAKIAGITMCEAYNQQYSTDFISAIPATIYGPFDNFNLASSHVMSSLIRKFHEAKKEKKQNITIWGTGTPKREFLFVDDLVDACIFLMNNYNQKEPINVAYGKDISIKDLAFLIKGVIRFSGKLVFDKTKPDGMPKKLLDGRKMKSLGWFPKTDLKDGLEKTYNWYKSKNSMLWE